MVDEIFTVPPVASPWKDGPEFLPSLLSRSRSREVILKEVDVKGAEAFDDDFLKVQLQPLLKTQTHTVSSILSGSETAVERLKTYNIVRDASIELETISESKESSPLIVKAVIKIEPSIVDTVSIQTHTNDGFGAFGLNYLNNNMFGNSEVLQLNGFFGQRPDSKACSATFVKPSQISGSSRFKLNAFWTSADATWASHKQTNCGMIASTLKIFKNFGPFTSAEVGVSSVVRNITGVATAASDYVKRDSGRSTKTSMFGSLFANNLKYSSAFVTGGSFFKLETECGSLPKFREDIDKSETEISKVALFEEKFLKVQFSSLFAGSFLKDMLTLSMNFNAGALSSLDPSNHNTHISDRFFLGGPESIKGFQRNRIGLSDGTEYIGGESFLSGGVTLFSRIPRVNPASPLRLQCFVNGGDLYSLKDLKGAVSSVEGVQSIFKNLAYSAGMGLIYKSDTTSVDLSYCIPLTNRPSDTSKPGLQFEVSIFGF